ncbi:MAG: VWA domain-containing protein [Gammaproteobacteria bacterium]|nr:VWA domain-containing protein [Gammaproteobacteria bacterium]
MKYRIEFLIKIITFFIIIQASHFSLAQTTQEYLSTNRTVAPLGTDKSITGPAPGNLRYSDKRTQQPKVEIDTPDVSFSFEFSQNSPSNGTVRAILLSNIDLKDPALEIAVDGAFTASLSDKFRQSSRTKSAYRSVQPQKSFVQGNINASTSNSVVVDIPVTMSGNRGVLSISLQDSTGKGDAASLFLLRDNGRIYAGVQGFMFLQEQALIEKLKKEGVNDDKIIQQIKKLRSKPGDIKIKITPPAVGYLDTDPYNSIIVNGQIQFTDINGATFPVQNADVEVYDINGGTEVLMDSGSTDSSGNYSITVPGVDTAADGTGPDILVRSYPRGPLVRVHVADGGAVYTMDSPVQNDVVDDSTVTINMTAGNDESTVPGQVAYEVYEANRYFGVFITSVNGSAPSQILVEYPRSAAGDGSSYTPGSTRLNLSISDGHDWDNIQHEYGHHVANVFNLANNPGGPHSSSQNSCVVRPTKDEALRLAWGESWPTAYSIIAQNQQNLGTLGIPNLGDTSYTDTKPAGAALNYNIETGTTGQTGEATERAIMRVMWDTFDANNDSADIGVSYSAQSLWNSAISSNPERFSTYWAQFISLLTETQKAASGGTLTVEGFGATLTGPANGTSYSGGAAPNFTWTPSLPCDSGGNGRFSVHFQHQGTGALLYASPFSSSTTFTPTNNQLEQIFVAAGGNINWYVLTRDLTAPQTGDYYSQSRSVVDDFDVPDRDPVDIILALDLSSSMNSTPPDGTLPKIDVLQQAVELFINTWTVHAIPGDRMGLIYFNDNTSSIAGTPPALVLSDVATSALSFITDVNSKSGSGCTAIGGALQEAFNNFDMPDRSRFILLFSDGIQNVNPFVGEDASGNLQIQTLPTTTTDFPFGGFFCNTTTAQGLDGTAIMPDGELLADKGIIIHSIGVGVNGANFEDLIESISADTSGEHHFTSIPDAELDIYFANDLVESLKSNTLQVVKTDNGNVSASGNKLIQVPVDLSAAELTLAISWKNTTTTEPLSVTVTPPNGVSIPVTSNTLGQGHRVINYDLPIDENGMNSQGAGDWQVTLNNTLQEPVPFQFSAIVDEGCFKFDMTRPPGGLRAGYAVPVSVKLSIGKSPLLSADNIQVSISRPAQNRGQLLADWLKKRQEVLGGKIVDTKFVAALSASLSEEGQVLAEKSPYIIDRLETIAFADPEFSNLARKQEVYSMKLFDDGSAEHGDKVAGDGIYTNLVPRATIPGHYQLYFDYSATNQCGAITRTETSSFLVRLAKIVPAKSNLIINVAGNVTDVSITPVDGSGNILGPGYSDQITVEYGKSQSSGALIDHLDGSYTQRFTNVTDAISVTATIRGEKVEFTKAPPQPTSPCWIAWLLLALALLAAIYFLVAVLRGNASMRKNLIIAAVIAVIIIIYLALYC